MSVSSVIKMKVIGQVKESLSVKRHHLCERHVQAWVLQQV